MNKGHKYIAIIVWVVISTIDILLVKRRRFMPVNFALTLTLFKGPDLDKAHGKTHRHWFFHSLLIPIAIALTIHDMYFILVVWCTHLLCDIWQAPGKKPVGSYNIHGFGKRMKPWQTRIYLLLNGIIGLIISTIIASEL